MSDATRTTTNPECQTIQCRFETFHRNNPEVFALIVQEARKAVALKKPKFGVKQIIEHIRWELFLKTDDAPLFQKGTAGKQTFKLNNNYASRYARMLIERYPEFQGKIETRELLAA